RKKFGGGVTYKGIISVENLLEAWCEFVKGKRARKDVQQFEGGLMENLFDLHSRLANLSYRHGSYQAFTVCDPKTRRIHKATVADRVLHRAVYRKLYPVFDPTFISDSFSCRKNKGTHKALDRFRAMAWKVSRNHRRTVWVLKCDIRKFFASVDHEILLGILRRRLNDQRVVWLLEVIVHGFHVEPGKGLPLGNLTSQLFANLYMNEFDQFVKHRLQFKHYIRYADDFVFLSQDRQELEDLLSVITKFLDQELHLTIHPNKTELRTFASGVDFLGWVHFPDHRVLRTVAKRRMFNMLAKNPSKETKASYLGLLQHGNTMQLKVRLDEGNKMPIDIPSGFL
ncbi:MAG: reverse transcriptase domain-containing protein, partial [Candidatus Uhrbacteria bacterium]|nr:reverse transcriptase domain-containing protein [Candidatus Uhrbacteria bacterium]